MSEAIERMIAIKNAYGKIVNNGSSHGAGGMSSSQRRHQDHNRKNHEFCGSCKKDPRLNYVDVLKRYQDNDICGTCTCKGHPSRSYLDYLKEEIIRRMDDNACVGSIDIDEIHGRLRALEDIVAARGRHKSSRWCEMDMGGLHSYVQDTGVLDKNHERSRMLEEAHTRARLIAEAEAEQLNLAIEEAERLALSAASARTLAKTESESHRKAVEKAGLVAKDLARAHRNAIEEAARLARVEANSCYLAEAVAIRLEAEARRKAESELYCSFD